MTYVLMFDAVRVSFACPLAFRALLSGVCCSLWGKPGWTGENLLP